MIVCVHVYETNVESFFKVFIKTRLHSMTDIEIESPYPPLKKDLLSSYEEIFLPECFPLLIWLSCRDVSWMGSRLPLASCIWQLCEAGTERPRLFFPMQGNLALGWPRHYWPASHFDFLCSILLFSPSFYPINIFYSFYIISIQAPQTPSREPHLWYRFMEINLNVQYNPLI